jgi:hypothetical protein
MCLFESVVAWDKYVSGSYSASSKCTSTPNVLVGRGRHDEPAWRTTEPGLKTTISATDQSQTIPPFETNSFAAPGDSRPPAPETDIPTRTSSPFGSFKALSTSDQMIPSGQTASVPSTPAQWSEPIVSFPSIRDAIPEPSPPREFRTRTEFSPELVTVLHAPSATALIATRHNREYADRTGPPLRRRDGDAETCEAIHRHADQAMS